MTPMLMTPLSVTPTMRLLFLAIWLASGLVSSIILMRHGHRHWYWLLVGMCLGPLAGLIFRERSWTDSPQVEQVRRGRTGPGLHVLIGIDGSSESARAAGAALDLLDAVVGRATVATVVDYDTAQDPAGEADLAARSRLGSVAGSLRRWDPDEVVLAGPPVDALLDFAVERDVDLIVVGPRGRGFSRRILGSVCVGLVSRAQVPVLVLGGDPEPRPEPHRTSAAATDPHPEPDLTAPG